MGIFTSTASLRSFVEDADVELPLPDEAIDNHEEVEDAHTGEIDPDPIVDPVEEAYIIAAESERNFGSLMLAVGMQELMSYQESGIDFIHEAPNVKAFFSKVKQFFITLKEKIWSVVKNFIAAIQSRFMKGEKFATKYGDQIRKGFAAIKDDDFKVKGFKFTHVDFNIANDIKEMGNAIKGDLPLLQDAQMADVEKFINSGDHKTMSGSDVQSLLGTYRAVCVGSNGELSDSEFTKELFKFFRNGESEKKELKKSDVNINRVLDSLKAGRQAIKKANTNYRDLEKELNKCIKKTSEFESKLANYKGENQNAGKALSAVSQMVSISKSMLNICNQLNSAHLSAMKAELAQSRRIAMRCISRDNKVEKKLIGNESASLIGSVQFI